MQAPMQLGQVQSIQEKVVSLTRAILTGLFRWSSAWAATTELKTTKNMHRTWLWLKSAENTQNLNEHSPELTVPTYMHITAHSHSTQYSTEESSWSSLLSSRRSSLLLWCPTEGTNMAQNRQMRTTLSHTNLTSSYNCHYKVILTYTAKTKGRIHKKVHNLV